METVTVTRQVDAPPEDVEAAIRDLGPFMRAGGFDEVTVDGDEIHLENAVGLATVELDLEVVEDPDATLRERGIDTEHVRRDDREGYKAGAVERGLESATGEFVALFDADFVPPPDFRDPDVGCVQTRWEHCNESHSRFTRAQALALDAHFAVEQWVRAEVGSLMSFNATSCVWRRETIDDVGGWSSETVAEDLDLTAEALLAGWEFVYTEG